jgi:hypothetical protein
MKGMFFKLNRAGSGLLTTCLAWAKFGRQSSAASSFMTPVGQRTHLRARL